LGPGVRDSEGLLTGAVHLRASVSAATESKGGWEAVGTQKDVSVALGTTNCCLATFFGSCKWNVCGLIFPEHDPIVNRFFPSSPVDISTTARLAEG